MTALPAGPASAGLFAWEPSFASSILSRSSHLAMRRGTLEAPFGLRSLLFSDSFLPRRVRAEVKHLSTPARPYRAGPHGPRRII